MKPRVFLLLPCLLAAGAGPASSQTPGGTPNYFGSTSPDTKPSAVIAGPASTGLRSTLEKEFAQLQEQHEKALAASTDAINRQHIAALASLLLRAKQANDTPATNTINAELQRLRVAVQANSDPGNLTTDGLTTFLVGTKWTWFGSETLTFLADGKALWSQDEKPWPWKVSNTKNLVIEARNMKLERNFTITFDRDLKTATINGDNATRKTLLIK